VLNLPRREFVAASAAASLSLALPQWNELSEPIWGAEQDADNRPIGPLLGHVDQRQGLVWFRATQPGRVELKVTEKSTGKERTLTAEALEANDLCMKWTVPDLQSGEYTAEVLPGDAAGRDPLPTVTVKRPPADEAPTKVSLVFGSCASSTKFFEIWDRMATVGADAVVLLGDTPYIDKTDLASNRRAHRAFLRVPNLAELLRTRPLWASWDDHDFGGNDTDGKVKNKGLIRQAFCEYRAQPQFGDGEQGIYTKFRFGPVEVFLIDPRYFSQTEPSPVDNTKPTCLGTTQWKWLLAGLKESTAPFKVLATGMIWDDKQNREKDDWQTYAHERDALFDFIAEHKIPGVLLMGGDIHVSRHLTYPSRVGYDLHQCIVSPLHDRIIKELNVPHPALVWGEPIPNVFLQLVVDSTQQPATLQATWFDMHGQELHVLKTTGAELSARRMR
jgi:alkaline phosphatase D